MITEGFSSHFWSWVLSGWWGLSEHVARKVTEVILCLLFLMSSVRDMQQMYELWLELTNQNRRTDTSAVTPPPEDKQVTLTAEYTESMVGTFYISC